jgi:site-specific recombinase XerD
MGGDESRDLARLRVPLAGALEETGDRWMPFRLTDPAGAVVEPVSAFFADLLAAGRSEATVRSYGMDLLRWFRFVWAAGVPWTMATRAEARDFCRWMQVAGKPARAHWRTPGVVPESPAAGAAYSPSVRAHSETVLRGFYEFHLEAGTGPIVNPFPLDRSRRGGRAHAHHNPMDAFRNERTGLFRPRVPSRIPRSVPDEEFNEIFARLPSHRDRALVAFYVSTGARASELLSATQGGADPGRQLIAVTRKGTRAVQELPASTDAFVWLRLYQLETGGLIPKGRRQPLWWTSRRPFVPLTYHTVHRMFERVGGSAGSAATLHALRHTAAYRMAEDPELPLTDVQYVLGHAQLTTTQIYLTPRKEDVVRRVLAHHQEQARQAAARARPAPAPGYSPETLDVLFGGGIR